MAENQALFEACNQGNLEEVKKLLQSQTIHINHENELYHFTPLAVACRKGHIDVIKCLLADPRIHVNKISGHGTEFFHACQMGQKEVIELLLKDPRVDINQGTSWGDFPLAELFLKKKFTLARLLLNDERIDVNKKGSLLLGGSERTLLVWACEQAQIDAVKILLAHKKININFVNQFGQSALSFACTQDNKNRLEIFKCLLNDERTQLNQATIEGQSLLIWTFRHKLDNHLQLLLTHSRIEINKIGENGLTFLSWACGTGETELVKKLLARPDIDINTNKENANPLFMACKWRQTAIVKLLLADPRTDINIMPEDNFITSFAMLCSEEKSIPLVKLFLALEGDRLDVNKAGPLSQACQLGDLEKVKLLLADPRVDINGAMDKADEYERSPLAWACQKGYDEIVKLFLALENIDINASNKYGHTPLSSACDGAHMDIIELLLKDPRIDITAGEPPLIYATVGRIHVLKRLLDDPRFDLMVKDSKGNNAFAVAARHQFFDPFKVLLIEKIIREPHFKSMAPLEVLKTIFEEKEEDIEPSNDPNMQALINKLVKEVQQAQNDTKAIYARRKELAADYNALMLYHFDGVLKVKQDIPENQQKQQRFFAITARLSQELQDKLSYNLAGANGTILTEAEKITAIKKLNKKLS